MDNETYKVTEKDKTEVAETLKKALDIIYDCCERCAMAQTCLLPNDQREETCQEKCNTFAFMKECEESSTRFVIDCWLEGAEPEQKEG